MKKITSHSPAETRKLGLKLAKTIKAGEILALIGDLGSGKTTFLQGVARGLSIRRKIKSPTFVQLKIYPIPAGKNSYLYHFDFYRLDSLSQIEEKGLKEYLGIKKGVVVIEWADKVKKILPRQAKIIRFDFIDKNKRQIIFH